MKRGCPNHPKTFSLAEALGIRRVHAVGLLELLFHFTAEFAPVGDVGKYSDKRIAGALDWSGSHSKLIQALVETGWLDSHAGSRLVVHDWSEHADRATLQRLTRNGLLPIQLNQHVTGKLCTLPAPEPAPEPEPTPTPQVARSSPLSFPRSKSDCPETHAAVRQFFPTADSRIVTKIVQATHGVCPDAEDCEIADAVRGSFAKGQRSAGLFLTTVPEFVANCRARAPDPKQSKAEQDAAYDRIRELWSNSKTPEQRAEIEAVYPELWPKGPDEKHAS